MKIGSLKIKKNFAGPNKRGTAPCFARPWWRWSPHHIVMAQFCGSEIAVKPWIAFFWFSCARSFLFVPLKEVYLYFFPQQITMDVPNFNGFSPEKTMVPVGVSPGGWRNPGNQWYQSGPLALHLSPIKIRCGIPWDKTPSFKLVLWPSLTHVFFGFLEGQTAVGFERWI